MSGKIKAVVVDDKVSDTDWGNVDKTELNKRAREMFTAGELTRDQVREIWAVVKEGAFSEDADGNPKLVTKYLWGPHHELRTSGDIVLNRGGTQSTAVALGGGRAEPDLTESEMNSGKSHIRGHYRNDLDVDMANLPDSLKASLLEAWDEMGNDTDTPGWIDNLRKDLQDLAEWSSGGSDGSEDDGTKYESALLIDAPSDVSVTAEVMLDVVPRHFGGAESFGQYDEFVAAEKREWEIQDLFYTFDALLDNIRNDITLTPDQRMAATADLVSELQDRVSSVKVVTVAISGDNFAKIGARHSSRDMNLIQQAHDVLCDAGAVCHPLGAAAETLTGPDKAHHEVFKYVIAPPSD